MQKRRGRLTVALVMIFVIIVALWTVVALIPAATPPAHAQGVFRRGQQGTEDAEQQKREAEEKKKQEAEEAKKAEDARKAEEARKTEEAKRAEAARARERQEAAEHRRVREVEERQRQEAERKQREAENRQRVTLERAEQRPPTPTPSPSVSPSPATSQGRIAPVERRSSPAPVERTGDIFERVQERARPVPRPEYIPRYYPYDYEWYRYYNSFPIEREIIIVREEPQVVIIERSAPEPQAVQQVPTPISDTEIPTPDDAQYAPAIPESAEAPRLMELDAPESFVFWPGTAERAFEEIGRGWMSGNSGLITRYIAPDVEVRIYRDGQHSHNLKGDEFVELTEDAMGRLQTIGFSIQILTRLDSKVFARGVHSYIGEDGETRRAAVNYTLKKIGEDWIIVEAGFGQPAPAPEIPSRPEG